MSDFIEVAQAARTKLAYDFENSNSIETLGMKQEDDSTKPEVQDYREGEEAARLRVLAAEVRDQNELERNIGRMADQMLTEQANERDQKRLEKTASDKEKLTLQISKLERKLNQPTGPATSVRLQAEIANYRAQVDRLDTDANEIQERIDNRQHEFEDHGTTEETGNHRMPNESQRDFLIRTGKITPFSKMPGATLGRSGSTLQDVLLDAEEGLAEDPEEIPQEDIQTEGPMSHRNLIRPGFVDDYESETASDVREIPHHPKKRKRLNSPELPLEIERSRAEADERRLGERSRSSTEDRADATFTPEVDTSLASASGTDIYEASEDDVYNLDTPISKRKRKSFAKDASSGNSRKEDVSGLDDGNEKLYQSRLQDWIARRSTARRKANRRKSDATKAGRVLILEDEDSKHGPTPAYVANPEPEDGDLEQEEWHMSHPTNPDHDFGDGYRMPGDIYPSLFDYQKTGVQWLWELYSQQVGGIIGDEMGLGKTIQAISFLAGLHYSKMITRPIIVVAPATVMKQWVNEFHTWWPPFRVSILHTSGSGMIDIGREARREEELSAELLSSSRQKPQSKSYKAAKRIVDRAVKDGHILVTTYSGLQTYAELLIPVNWEYAVLDEGHKIRNPNTAITIYCKELRTSNRIILSGTPIQNNLIELWSLFDFIFPMRLGTLVNFRNQFEIPIRQGGYANASNLQVQTASKCAETLKDTISPYLLQRIKADVAADLPKKTEQVLFCKLTRLQREAYENFLSSDEMKSILNGKRQVLYGIDILRKICNHPDLVEHKKLSVKPNYKYGSSTKSGKMVIVKELLDVWKKGGHKTLLFAQHRIMLDILEKYIKTVESLRYRRMDGNTPITSRQAMVDDFNNNPDIHVFLLTTKVGGLGVNLTGADRVIIFDPDWNPSTDIQARERAWRLGQKREVQIYRLMVAGTIEEKIFHRQIFKQFLTNKILKDPKQRQTFHLKDLHDLFTLGGADEEFTETSRLFKDAEVKFGDDDSKKASPSNDKAPGLNEGLPVEQADRDRNIREILGVASLEEYAPDVEEQKDKTAPTDAANSEARIMEGIFVRSGIHSAIEHDQIINGKRVITADPRMIDKEARKVAAQAAEELRKAEEVARNVPVGTPTWTGQFGVVGRPSDQSFGRGRGRGGPASSTILAGLQSRQAASNPGSSASTTRSSEQNTPRGKDFMKLIRDYLNLHGGKAYTQMLIDHFNRYCNSSDSTAQFKAMLKEIATLQKGRNGRGSWALKEEYRSTPR